MPHFPMSKPSPASRLCPLAALTTLALFVLVSRAATPAKPNVILIYSDDHGWADLGAQGVDRDIRTPHLDALAREGVRFARGYVTAPQCVPSRAGYLTGRSAVAARMTRFSAALPRDEVTFLELLRQQGGYHTGIAGRSYHLDGSARGGPEISRLMEQHRLRSFTERVDYLRTGSDAQAVVQLEEFLDGRPARRCRNR